VHDARRRDDAGQPSQSPGLVHLQWPAVTHSRT
jgi:hypothetical protein